MRNRINKPVHPLFAAVASGNLPAINKVMDDFPDLEVKDGSGNTPLLLAASTGQAEAAAMLISRGANLESQTDSGHTPLWQAVENGHENVVRLLTAVGADVNGRNQRSYTVLMHAVLRGCRNIVGMLLQAGARPNLAAENGDTAETIAVANSRFDIVELLRMNRYTLAGLNFNLEAILDVGEVPAPIMEAAEAEEVEPPESEGDQSERDEEEYLGRYICPISQEVMNDPVTLPSGKTFDRLPLAGYVESLHNPEEFPCPLTRKPTPIAALTYDTNTLIKQEIVERRKQLEDKKQEREERAALQDLRNKRVRYYQEQGLFAVNQPACEVPLPPSPEMRH